MRLHYIKKVLNNKLRSPLTPERYLKVTCHFLGNDKLIGFLHKIFDNVL